MVRLTACFLAAAFLGVVFRLELTLDESLNTLSTARLLVFGLLLAVRPSALRIGCIWFFFRVDFPVGIVLYGFLVRLVARFLAAAC